MKPSKLIVLLALLWGTVVYAAPGINKELSENADNPVVYKELKGIIHNNELQVSWTTSTEINNSHFEVEVSADGVNYKKAGAINSKAVSGNSSILINYQFTMPLEKMLPLFGISFLLMGCIFVCLGRKNIFRKSFSVIIISSFFFVSCNKNDHPIDFNNNGLYVKIAQVDKNNKVHYSTIITAYKAD